MFTFLIILAIIVSVLLILIVLIQNSKGGGISANFSAANQIAGVKKTNDFIEKATWTLAIALMVLSLGSRFVYTTDIEKSNQFLDEVENAAPVFNSPEPDAGVNEGDVSDQGLEVIRENEDQPAE